MTMQLEIMDLNHVALHTNDLDRSMKFYGETLGLTLLPRPPFGFPGAWYKLADGELHLIADPEFEVANARHHFAVRVPDADALVPGFQAANVKIISVGNRADGWRQVFISDPDGYTMEFTSEPKG